MMCDAFVALLPPSPMAAILSTAELRAQLRIYVVRSLPGEQTSEVVPWDGVQWFWLGRQNRALL